MSGLYQVVFTGQLRPGINAEQAARDFGAVFKVPDDKAWRLVLSGKERVLKHDVAETSAERYRELLEEIGLMVRLEPAGTARRHADAPENPGQAPAPGAPGAGDAPRADSESASAETLVASSIGAPEVDPYAPPAADLTGGEGEPLDDDPMTGPHALTAGHGWQWISGGWQLFKGAPLAWFGAVLLLGMLNLLIAWIPFVGGIVGTLLGPVFLGGLMLGAHAQANGGSLHVGDLFSGFSANPGRLMLVGALYLLAIIAVMISIGLVVAALAIGVSGLDPAMLESQDPELLAATLGPMALLALLFMMLLIVPVIMAYWFAPLLVVLEDMEPIPAMKLSFTACWRNMLPFLLYGLIAMALLILGTIPLLLGLLIVSPILVASMYAAYRDIFYRGLPSA